MPVQFRIKYRVADGERIYVIGDIPELGKWDEMHAPRLAQPVSDRVPVESGLWVLDMHILRDVAHTQFEYKYFTRKSDGARDGRPTENWGLVQARAYTNETRRSADVGDRCQGPQMASFCVG